MVINTVLENNKTVYNCKCGNCGNKYKTNSKYYTRFCGVECCKQFYTKLKDLNYKTNDVDKLLTTKPSKEDYIKAYKPGHKYCWSGGQILEHRIIAEQKIGRQLEPNEVVHHIDKDITNNDPDNLMIFANISEHTKYHHQLNQ